MPARSVLKPQSNLLSLSPSCAAVIVTRQFHSFFYLWSNTCCSLGYTFASAKKLCYSPKLSRDPTSILPHLPITFLFLMGFHTFLPFPPKALKLKGRVEVGL